MQTSLSLKHTITNNDESKHKQKIKETILYDYLFYYLALIKWLQKWILHCDTYYSWRTKDDIKKRLNMSKIQGCKDHVCGLTLPFMKLNKNSMKNA